VSEFIQNLDLNQLAYFVFHSTNLYNISNIKVASPLASGVSPFYGDIIWNRIGLYASIYSIFGRPHGFDISWLRMRTISHNLTIRRFERPGLSNPYTAADIGRDDVSSLSWGRGGSDVCPGLPRSRDGL